MYLIYRYIYIHIQISTHAGMSDIEIQLTISHSSRITCELMLGHRIVGTYPNLECNICWVVMILQGPCFYLPILIMLSCVFLRKFLCLATHAGKSTNVVYWSSGPMGDLAMLESPRKTPTRLSLALQTSSCWSEAISWERGSTGFKILSIRP